MDKPNLGRASPRRRRSALGRARSLIVLHDDHDLTDVLACVPQALAGTVLAFDTDIHLRLLSTGVEHITPWHVVGHGEYAQVQRLENAIWRHWTRNARLPFEGLDLLGMAAYRHVSAFARLAWAAYALRRVVEALNPQRVFVFAELPAHGLDQPADYRRMPLLSGLLRGLADERGLHVHPIPRGAASEFHDQVAERDCGAAEPVDLGSLARGRPLVLAYANGTELLRQRPLIEALEKQGGCAAIQVYKTAEADVLASLAGSLVLHESQLCPPGAAPDVHGIATAARARLQSAATEPSADAALVFRNPHLRSHFDFLFGSYAARMARHVRAWRRAFSAMRPAALLTSYQAPALDVATDIGVPCLVLPHGLMTIGQPTQFTTLPRGAHIAAISRLHRERLLATGVSAARIHVTGDPWSTRLAAEADRFRDTATAREATERARRRLDITPDRRMVLLCTGSYGMPSVIPHLPQTDWRDALRQIRRLGELCGRRPEWAFVLRCHPRFDYQRLYDEVNRRLPADRRLVIAPGNLSLTELAAAADVVCVWNVVTSALVEASLVGRPVIQCLPSVIWCDREQWGIDAWPEVAGVEALELELDRLFSRPAHYTACVRATRAAVTRYLDERPGESAARCADQIAAMVTEGASNPPNAMHASCAAQRAKSLLRRATALSSAGSVADRFGADNLTG
ncbi:MAG: hypothetical protein HRF50_16625 [Phycisphaerae bacterium]|jgi:hypothetical protein